ncbi:7-cyano-7-deazaguanine synthase [Phenylobacterium haematophilum]|uniref:7-cyano-7-deazaguanine synthase n=1 Tax=Phenylobacterium haematophilum TaxID=98513 RepID=A0A839ZVH1_9CAUL|nr:7-cyano-7-deazaguanine synthase [Phenylobacterium haematophilum]MBB3890465.1 7-cyano-7-deazaguanine synthase [Phenylobacterium haematophilum]
MRAILMSGGMDSISVAWWRRPDVAIFVDYGQRAAQAEFDAGAAACAAMEIRHEAIKVDCSALGSGDMAGTPASAVAPVPEWWPFRNQLLLTLAGMFAIKLGARRLEIGALRTDGEHADGRPEFIERISALMAMQEGGLTVEAPAIGLDAVELVRTSAIPREVLGWAHSCHTGNLACGQCRGCIKHYKTWEALGWDPH